MKHKNIERVNQNGIDFVAWIFGWLILIMLIGKLLNFVITNVQFTYNAPLCKKVCIWTRYNDELGGWKPYKLF